MGDEGENKDLLNTAVFVFAHYLGIDINTETDLIWIAEEAFEKLPDGWEFGVADEGDHAGIPYFYNSETGQSVWTHPLEDIYKKKLKRERQLKQEKQQIEVSISASKAKEVAEVEEVMDFEDDEVEDLEDHPSHHHNNQNSNPNNPNNRNNNTKNTIGNNNHHNNTNPSSSRPSTAVGGGGGQGGGGGGAGGFGMSEEDFDMSHKPSSMVTAGKSVSRGALALQDNPPQTHGQQQQGPQGQQVRDVSPPMFRDYYGGNHHDEAPPQLGQTQQPTRLNNNNNTNNNSRPNTANSNSSSTSVNNLVGGGGGLKNTQRQQQQNNNNQQGGRGGGGGGQQGGGGGGGGVNDPWFRVPQQQGQQGQKQQGQQGGQQGGRDESRGRGGGREGGGIGGGGGGTGGGGIVRVDRTDRDLSSHGNNNNNNDNNNNTAYTHNNNNINNNNNRFNNNNNNSVAFREEAFNNYNRASTSPTRYTSSSSQQQQTARQPQGQLQQTAGPGTVELTLAQITSSPTYLTLQTLYDQALLDRDRFQIELTDNRKRLSQETAHFTQELQLLQGKLAEERRSKHLLEDEQVKLTYSLTSLQRDQQEREDTAVREALRKLKMTSTEESLQKLTDQQRKYLAEIDELKAESAAWKRKMEEVNREKDVLSRKLSLAVEETRFSQNLEKRDLELSLQEKEFLIDKLRKEVIAHQEMVGTIKQSMHQLVSEQKSQQIEKETLQRSNASLQSEILYQTTMNTSLTNRLTSLEQELPALEIEKRELAKEKDKLSLTLSKLESSTFINQDHMTSIEQEKRRLKTTLTMDVTRLTSKIVELEAYNSILKEQTEKQTMAEQSLARQSRQQIDQLTAEISLLQETNLRLTLLEDTQCQSLREIETEKLKLFQSLQTKEKALGEVEKKVGMYNAFIASFREEYEGKVEKLTQSLAARDTSIARLQTSLATEKQSLQEEITANIPKLIAKEVEKAEVMWQESSEHRLHALLEEQAQGMNNKHRQEIGMLGQMHDQQMKRLERGYEEKIEEVTRKWRKRLEEVEEEVQERYEREMKIMKKKQIKMMEELNGGTEGRGKQSMSSMIEDRRRGGRGGGGGSSRYTPNNSSSRRSRKMNNSNSRYPPARSDYEEDEEEDNDDNGEAEGVEEEDDDEQQQQQQQYRDEEEEEEDHDKEGEEEEEDDGGDNNGSDYHRHHHHQQQQQQYRKTPIISRSLPDFNFLQSASSNASSATNQQQPPPYHPHNNSSSTTKSLRTINNNNNNTATKQKKQQPRQQQQSTPAPTPSFTTSSRRQPQQLQSQPRTSSSNSGNNSLETMSESQAFLFFSQELQSLKDQLRQQQQPATASGRIGGAPETATGLSRLIEQHQEDISRLVSVAATTATIDDRGGRLAEDDRIDNRDRGAGGESERKHRHSSSAIGSPIRPQRQQQEILLQSPEPTKRAAINNKAAILANEEYSNSNNNNSSYRLGQYPPSSSSSAISQPAAIAAASSSATNISQQYYTPYATNNNRIATTSSIQQPPSSSHRGAPISNSYSYTTPAIATAPNASGAVIVGEEASFVGIRDGGYYEGYWRTKYASGGGGSKQLRR